MMKKIVYFLLIVINAYALTEGTDNNSVNIEMRKVVAQIAPGTDRFKWRCTTVHKHTLMYVTTILDKCLIQTDININFNVICERQVLAIGSTIDCKVAR